MADFSGADYLIYRETQRTEQYDLKQLNQPDFVSTVERNDYVMFFFRELAMEHMNHGKAVYSRVGRVCKNDRGGPYKSNDRWTSFLKARLNCSVPGDYPFYFDDIRECWMKETLTFSIFNILVNVFFYTESTSAIVEGMYDASSGDRQAVIYAVFTTPENSIPGSAVCAFRMDDIMAAFEGRFKSQRDATSNWLPIAKEAVPEPRPGRCVDDSRTLHTMSVNFIKTHTLMETVVRSMHDRPLLTRVNLKHSFTAITVDPQVRALDGNFYDVIFVGTNDGRVLKLANVGAGRGDKNATNEATVITETQVLGADQPVRQLSVSRATGNLIVVGDGRIVATPLHHCNKISVCRKCLALQDPYCSWDIRKRECSNVDFSSDDANAKAIQFIQMLQPLDMDLCRKHGETDHLLEPPPKVTHSARGGLVVAAVGRALPQNFDDEYTVAVDDDNGQFSDINQISIVDSSLTEQQPNADDATAAGVHMGSPSMVVLACVLFVAGIMGGVVVSRLRHKFSPCYNEHRNQINS